MKRTCSFGINVILFCLFLGFSSHFVCSQHVPCDVDGFRTCFQRVVDTALATLSENVEDACSGSSTNITADRDCVTSFLSECSVQFGTEQSALLHHYVETLDDVFTTICDQDFQFSQPEVCDLELDAECLQHFSDVLLYGSITTVCRQLDVTLTCVKPSLDSCTDRPRYFIGRLINELQLIADTICYESGCNLDIAKECVQDANEIYDYPITIVSQSSLVCNKLKASLACAYNHTYTCIPAVIPPGILANYAQMVQFTSTYCGVRADSFNLVNIPEDLKSTVVLASLSTNRWASVDSICSIYNETLLRAANEGRILTQYTTDLLTWQNAMKLNLDKYADVCFMEQMADCDWVERLANEQPVCDPDAAERCFDLVLLSKLIVETKVQRSTWETVCVAAMNMVACAQYHTGDCTSSDDVTKVTAMSAEVESLVGYECMQIGMPDRPESCDGQVDICDVHAAIENCADPGNSTEICSNKEEIIQCFQDHTSSCNSVQASSAQFYMEWLLNECELNSTLIVEDTLMNVATCSLQFGYTVYNGMQTTTDFGSLICNALSVYGACIAQQNSPALATYYLNQYGSDLVQIQFIACNATGMSMPSPPAQEDEACPVEDLLGKISLAIQVSSTFPLLSLQGQDKFCSMVETRDNTSISACSQTRQAVINGGRNYLSVLYGTFCSVKRQDMVQPCNVQTLQMCFKNFGAFTYFSTPVSDVCGQLEETYNCIYEHAKGCAALESHIVDEIRVMQSLVGNITCPQLSWCSDINNSSEAWMTQICSPPDSTCDILNWASCLVENGYFPQLGLCQNQVATTACIEEKLSGCDPVQYLIAQNEMFRRQVLPFCQIAPDPAPVTIENIHFSIWTCYNIITSIFQSGDVSKSGICSVLSQFQQCVGSLNQTAIPSVWQGVFMKSRLMWEKELFLHCRLSQSTDEFVVDPDFERNNIFGNACNANQGTLCLYYSLELLVGYQPFVPLDSRFTDYCQRFKGNNTCVLDQTAGCLIGAQQSLLTTAEWVKEASDNIGTCSETWTEPRLCDPHVALQCMHDLGQMLAQIDSTDEDSKIKACSKLQSTTLCVNKYTSACDYDTRLEIETTFYELSTITSEICTVQPTSSASCINAGETMTCNVEEALMCLIPVQTSLLRQDANFQEVCGKVPEMKTCIHRYTTGCDAYTMASLDQRLHLLSHRMNDQCPYIFCKECKARQCLENLYQVLQYEDVNLCLAVTETRQCIYHYTNYCDSSVSASLMQEMSLLVGEEGQICSVSIETCLQNFFTSAFQIVNYNPQFFYMNQNMSSMQTDVVFTQMCQEASAAYYCVEFHLKAEGESNVTMMGTRNMTVRQEQRLSLLNVTLQRIGDFVGHICQGPRLECYSCVNTTSNEECNMQDTQTCPYDRQMCGTLIMNNTISKGCVAPQSCQTGCMGDACTFCCEGDLCNQPWNTVIQEPDTCQPESALWCGFQLLHSLVQNDTINCRVFQEALSCMSESTRTCLSPKSADLGVFAQHLMSSDFLSACVDNNTACSCGQCSSLVLLSVITSPYNDVDMFCKTIWKLYNETLQELDINTCDIMTLQSTAYNLDMAAYLARGICDVDNDGDSCTYGDMTYKNGDSFTAMDGCNTCSCMNGEVACTLMYCPPTDDSCFYNNQRYESGDSFKDADGCNTCSCFNGNVGCTKMYCPLPDDDTTGDCDIYEIYTCMTEADLFNKVSQLTTTESPELCSSAAHMLSCLEPKLSTCSHQILYVVQGAIMENLYAVQGVCDIQDIIMNYRDWDKSGNETDPDRPDPENPRPDPVGECSIEKGLQCFDLEETGDKCEFYQSLIDCVHNFTYSCMSVDVVPVTYQLQYILQSYSEGCDLDIPSRPVDPLYPIAQCTMEFATSLNYDLSGSYLPYQRLDSTCGHLEEYGKCLYSAHLPPLGRFYVWKIESSLSMLVRLCQEYNQEQYSPCAAVSCVRPDCDNPYTPEGQCCPVCPESTIKCHNCSMTTDVEACDNMEPETCHPYQVCGTIMEMEANSGVTMVRKGCADLSWCETWMGCNPQTTTCVTCCYGDLCNKAFSTPEDTTRSHEVTTGTPATCTLEPISTYMVMQILKLMNHDIMPIREREYACHNVTSDFETLINNLDTSCPDEVLEHVAMATDWLNQWTRSVCRDMEAENKCMESVQCMENFGNFPDKDTTCRTLAEIQSCLKKHIEYCGDQDRASINQTSQLLHNMEHVICVPNKLADKQTPDCINATDEYRMNHTGVCNMTRVEECVMSLQKASNNPFVTREEFCRLAKTGMKCIQDNTFNCSDTVVQNIAPYLMEVVDHVNTYCPQTWCPEFTHCRLETAKKCLSDLEDRVRQAISEEEFDQGVCMEFSKTHDCIMNATYECYPEDTQMVIYNFTQLAMHVAPACVYQPPNVTECGITFLHTLDNLVHFDTIFLTNLANAYSNYQSMMSLLEAVEHFLKDLYPDLIPDSTGNSTKTGGSDTFSNPYVRKKRADHSTSTTNPDDGFWTDSKEPSTDTAVSTDTADSPERDESRPELRGINLPYLSSGDATTTLNQILSQIGMERKDLGMLIDPSVLMQYSSYKSSLCHVAEHAYWCLEQGTRQVFFTGKQEYIVNMTLSSLASVAMDECQGMQVCHSCNGLESNAECNRQTPVSCPPLQMCQTKYGEGNITKGCSSVLTCEEECRHSDHPCYCCQGHMCNKRQGPKEGYCDKQSAVKCTQDLLRSSLYGDIDEHHTDMYQAATCMMETTRGCHGDAYYNIYQKGEVIKNLLSAAACVKKYGDAFCGSSEAVALAAIVSNPLKTPVSMEMTCSLFETTLYTFYIKEQEGAKCYNMEEVNRAFKTIYAEIESFCGSSMVTDLCSLVSNSTEGNETIIDRIRERITDRISDRLSNGNTILGDNNPLRNMLDNIMQNSSRPGSDVNRTGSDVIQKFCSDLESQSEGQCQVTSAIVECFSSVLYEESPVCDESNPDYPVVLQCIQNYTSGCVDAELTLVLLTHTIICGKPLRTEQNSSTDDLVECLQVLGDITTTLSEADDVYGSACTSLQEAERCLDSAHISTVDEMLLHQMFTVLGTFKKDVCSLVTERYDYLISCEVEPTTPCNGSVCDVSTCTAYPGAICVEDGCNACDARFYFRGEEVTANCSDVIPTDVCNVKYLARETMISVVLTAGLENLPWTEQTLICSLPSFMDVLKQSASECPSTIEAPLTNLLSWLKEKGSARCHSNKLSYACLLPSCDVNATLGIIGDLGYYLTVASFDDEVFCQKVENTMYAVECSLNVCEEGEDLSQVEESLMYVKSYVRDRCPALTAKLFCSAGEQDNNRTTGDRSTVPQSSSNGQETRSRPKRDDHGNSTMDEMEGMKPAGEDTECPVPLCSYDEAEQCLKSCGSTEETNKCLMTSTEGCNPIHKYAIFSILKYTLVLQEVPRACWENVSLEVNESYASGVLQCIHDFTQNMDSSLTGNEDVSPCDLFVPLIECMDTELSSPDIPSVMANNLKHLITVASPTVNLICSQSADKRRHLVQVSEESGECYIETAARCLNYFSVNVLLNPTLALIEKQWTCKNIDNARECLEGSLRGCTSERKETAMTIYDVVQAMGILSGVCPPKPFTCEPAETLQCVVELATVVRAHGVTVHQGDVCRAIEHTEICFKQTTSYCDNATLASLQKTLEPIACQAYSICPTAGNKPTMTYVEPEKLCIPVEDKMHDKQCRTGAALQCFYQFYADIENSEGNSPDDSCQSYGKTLSCFHDNIQGCSDDFTVLLSLMIFKSWKADADTKCKDQKELFCDLEEMAPDCDLDGTDACLDTLRDVLENGNTDEMCFARREAERCIESKLSSCPQLVKMYGKSNLLSNSQNLDLSSMFDDIECDGIHQCAYAYTALLQEILLSGQNDATMDKDVDICESPQLREDVYPCRKRGQDLSCIYSNLEEFPNDVAMVINMTVNHLDGVFSDACGELLGWQSSSLGAGVTECYLSGIEYYLPLLLTFVDAERESNISSFSSFEFCSSYADWEASFTSYQAQNNCISDNTTVDFNAMFLSAMSQLETTYCTRPCNTTNAALCLANLEEAIATQTDEEVCSFYEEVKVCLEQAVSSCSSDISDEFFSQAEQYFTDAQIRCYTLPNIELTLPTSLSATSPVFEIMSGGDPLQFSVAVTSPVSDSCFTDSCELEFLVQINDVPVVSCSSGSITQFLANTCALYFTDESLGQQTLTYDLRVDHRIADPYNATFNFVARLWDNNTVVTVQVVERATVIVKEMQTGGYCDIVSDPMITTFDGLNYYNFRKGELVIYQHDTLPEKVHIAVQGCSLFSFISCPCAVMVVSGDDTFVVDTCRRFGEIFHPIEFRVYQNGELTPYTRAYASTTRESYQFVFPSGTIVYVYLVNNMLDVSIKPSALAWEHTSGLCGTYNGNPEDDFTAPDGTVTDPASIPIWSGLPVPLDYSLVWVPTESIFFGTTSDVGLEYMENARCDCEGLPCVPAEIVDTCDFVSAEDITLNLGPYLQPVPESARRKKRQVSDPLDVIDLSAGQSGVPNNTWPTPSGLTEAFATQHCNDAMSNSVSWDVCQNIVDTASTLQVCLANILLSDSTNSTSSVIFNMLTQCQIAVVTDPGILESLNTTLDKLFPFTFLCPNNCSSRGTCVNDTCECDAGYMGQDCSFVSSTPPTVTYLSETTNSVEDGTGSNNTIQTDVYVYGENFLNSNNLTCHQEVVEFSNGTYTRTGVITSSKATSLTFGRVMCSVTGTLPLTGLLISVSNDGETQSEGFLFIIQDTVCYSCNATEGQCSLQPVSCVIDGQCYGPGIFNPADGCYLCDPISNVWQYKISPTCPAPTTTTVTTTTAVPTTTTAPPTTAPTTTAQPTTTSAQPTTTTAPPTSTAPPTTTTVQPTTTVKPTTQPTTTTVQPTTTTVTTTSTTPPVTTTTAAVTTTTAEETTSLSQTTTEPVTTTPSSGATDGLGSGQTDDDDDDDDNTTMIVIIVASVLGGLLLLTVIVMAFKLRKSNEYRRKYKETKPKHIADSSSSADSSEQLAGQPNPSYVDAEDPRRSPRRDYAGRSGPFNPQGLSGESAYHRTEDGQHIDVAMFEQQGIPRPQVSYGAQGSREPYPDYDYDVIKKGSDISKQARRGDPLYDNAQRKAKADAETGLDLKEKIAPRSGFTMEDSALRPAYEDEDSITRL